MYLSKLEIQGFKSFAEKAVLEFNNDLTAIVGPNGSGKSNITDALRWVLGEQSLKILRGKKSEDVIFSGSSKRSRLGFAEVSMYLNNQDGSAQIDFQEVVITRRIYRSGENEYLINKAKVRLADIQMLLAKSNFGQRTYAIIGQGMIDSILISTPQERKEFFDEATGVLQFQLKKNQAANKLEHSRENLEQSQRLLAEIEPRLRSLVRQVKKLERREEIVKGLEDLQIKYYSLLYYSLSNEENGNLSKIKEISSYKAEYEKQIKNIQTELDSLQRQDTEAEAFAKLQSDLSQASRQKNDWLQQLSLVKGKLELGLAKVGKTDLIWLERRNSELGGQLEKCQQDLAEAASQESRLAKILEVKLGEQNKILEEYQKLQADLLALQQSLSGTEALPVAKIREHLQTLVRQQNNLIKSISAIKDLKQLADLEKEARAIAGDIDSLLDKIKEDHKGEWQSMVKIQNELNSFLTSKDLLVNEVQTLKIELEIYKQKKKEQAAEAKKLSEEIAKLSLELEQTKGKAEQDQGLLKQRSEIEKELNEIETVLAKLQEKLNSFSQTQSANKDRLFIKQRDLRDWQLKLDYQNKLLAEAQIELAKVQTKKEDLDQEVKNELGDKFRLIKEKLDLLPARLLEEINRLKNQLAIIGGIDQEVVNEYGEVKKHYDFLNEQSTDLNQAILSCQEIIEDLEEKIKQQFEAAFVKINEKFGQYFRILFNGGQAKLVLQKKVIEDEAPLENGSEGAATITEEPLPAKTSAKGGKKYELGIEIQATPPGKKLSSLNMLSGGEKALTSIALICAIIAQNPPPFVILDEVEAALDEANSERFIKIIHELSSQTQFITITHNRTTMQHAAILYGVTMGDDGISKLLSLNLAEAERVAK